MKLKSLLFFAVIVLVIFISCSKSSPATATCNWDSCAYKAPASEIKALHDSLELKNLAYRQQCSGLFYNIIDTGTGARPTACSTVKVNYVGRFKDSTGDKFDSGTISLPLTQVIPGWTDGVPLIRENGRIQLYIPPSLGYGPNQYMGIPGNSVLYFDVRLISVQ